MNSKNTEPEEATPTTNAVSLFGQNNSPSDFPVLKAFQEYIDAEQAKARKRMLGLSVFFILLLVVVVVTFTLVVMSVINRNQSLSDRLLDIALREKSPPQPVVNVQPPAPAPVVQPVVHQPSQEEALKPVLEKFDKLAEAFAKAQQQPVPVAQPAPVVVTTSPSPVVQPAAESAELMRLREELRREKEERKAEKEAKEKEEKRQAEIEAHRRRLYPEYYAQQDARSVSAPVVHPVPAPQGRQPVKLQPRSYFNDSVPDEDPELKELLKKVPPAPQPVAKPVPQPAQKPSPQVVPKPVPQVVPKPSPQVVPKPVPQVVPKPVPQPAVQPPSKPTPKTPAPPAVTPSVQLPERQEKKTETLAIGGADGSSIPWLIEIPQN